MKNKTYSDDEVKVVDDRHTPRIFLILMHYNNILYNYFFQAQVENLLNQCIKCKSFI